MSKERFYQLSYQEQFFHLIDFIYQEYAHNPYLFYVLKRVIEVYEHSQPFSKSILEDLHYNFLDFY